MSNKIEQFSNTIQNLWAWATMGGAIGVRLEAVGSMIETAAEDAEIPYKMLYVTLINDETGEVIDGGNIIDMIADHSRARVFAVSLSMVAGSINIRITEEEK